MNKAVEFTKVFITGSLRKHVGRGLLVAFPASTRF